MTTLQTTEARTLVTRKGKSVVTTLSDKAAYEICSSLKTVPFAQSLTDHRFDRMSSEQMIWCHILAVEASGPVEPKKVELAEQNPEVFGGIRKLFLAAGMKIKYPAVTLMTTTGIDVKINLAGSSAKYAGQIYVKCAQTYQYFGRIDQAGTFFPTPSCPDSVVALLKEFSADPAGVAAAYGNLSGRCCFCSSPLTDEKSIAVGYGPTCAKNFKLPYGVAAMNEARSKSI